MSTAALANELSVKKSQLAALSAKYTDKYPEIRRLKDEVAQLEKRLADAIAQEGPSEIFGTANAGTGAYSQAPGSRERDEILRLRAQSKALDSEIASLRKDRQGIEKAIAEPRGPGREIPAPGAGDGVVDAGLREPESCRTTIF